METVGLLLLGLALGVLLGGAGAWIVLQQRAERQLRAQRAADEEAARSAYDDALRQAAERAAAADEHTRAMLAARQDAIVAQLHQQAARDRADVEQRLSAALAQASGLREALEAARLQHRELIEAQRREQAEREKGEAGQTQVLKTLQPVAEQLRAMQSKVDELEKARAEQHGQLATQIRQTQTSVEESKRAAEGLASALKNNAVRGVWGETQLKTLVESAGLINHVDFDLQRSIQADSGARRPDMVINLPGGKQMAVDAKAPYNAFIDAHQPAIGPEDRQRLLVDHARKVRGHVDALASKSYWTGLPASPEFTVAFIPNEQLLNAALETDPSLLEYAFGKGVVLATPTNLWTVLKTVAYTWKQDVLTEDAKRLFDLGRELYRRVVTLAEHADKLRRSLESTVTNYNRFASSLESRVLVTARKLDQMDEAAVLGAPQQIEATPKALTADDFAALADLDRPELDLTLAFEDPVEAEIVDEADAG